MGHEGNNDFHGLACHNKEPGSQWRVYCSLCHQEHNGGIRFVGIVSAKNDPKKMEKAGWNIEKATMVGAPVFTDFPMTLECRIKEKYDESETGYYLVAEIVNILVDEKYLAEDGNPDMEKMELIVLDPIHHGYIQLGNKVGNAFSDGKALR